MDRVCVQLIKYCAWEASFARRVRDVRLAESGWLRRAEFTKAFKCDPCARAHTHKRAVRGRG